MSVLDKAISEFETLIEIKTDNGPPFTSENNSKLSLSKWFGTKFYGKHRQSYQDFKFKQHLLGTGIIQIFEKL